MKDYKVLTPLIIPCGQIKLEDEQASPRMEGLKKGRTKGFYDVLQPQQFKAGEVIGLNDVSKALLPCIEEVKKAK